MAKATTKKQRKRTPKVHVDRDRLREYWRDRASRWEEEMVAITTPHLPNFTATHILLPD